MDLTQSQLLLCCSLGFFVLEVLAFLFIKANSRNLENFDPLLDQLEPLFETLKPKHLCLYVGLYIGALFLAKRWMVLFIPILFLQAFSLIFDCVLIYRIKKNGPE